MGGFLQWILLFSRSPPQLEFGENDDSVLENVDFWFNSSTVLFGRIFSPFPISSSSPPLIITTPESRLVHESIREFSSPNMNLRSSISLKRPKHKLVESSSIFIDDINDSHADVDDLLTTASLLAPMFLSERKFRLDEEQFADLEARSSGFKNSSICLFLTSTVFSRRFIYASCSDILADNWTTKP